MAPRLLCPTCRREIQWSDQFPFRPFCSERCRLIDLGAWLSERHAIPGDAANGADAPDAGGQAPSGADETPHGADEAPVG